MKRLEAVSRSPIFSSLNEAIGGTATIRAFGIGQLLVTQHGKLVDENNAINFATLGMNRCV